VNLINNALQALNDSDRPDKRLVARIGVTPEQLVQLAIEDNGVGIAPEHLTRVFAHGFTTKKDGHGFGLHSAVIAANEMGGTLTAHSDGPGTGARFVLELPIKPTEVTQ
jgi:C4-dicarboxylate-specific signal transduction histidine kinase